MAASVSWCCKAVCITHVQQASKACDAALRLPSRTCPHLLGPVPKVARRTAAGQKRGALRRCRAWHPLSSAQLLLVNGSMLADLMLRQAPRYRCLLTRQPLQSWPSAGPPASLQAQHTPCSLVGAVGMQSAGAASHSDAATCKWLHQLIQLKARVNSQCGTGEPLECIWPHTHRYRSQRSPLAPAAAPAWPPSATASHTAGCPLRTRDG